MAAYPGAEQAAELKQSGQGPDQPINGMLASQVEVKHGPAKMSLLMAEKNSQGGNREPHPGPQALPLLQLPKPSDKLQAPHWAERLPDTDQVTGTDVKGTGAGFKS